METTKCLSGHRNCIGWDAARDQSTVGTVFCCDECADRSDHLLVVQSLKETLDNSKFASMKIDKLRELRLKVTMAVEVTEDDELFALLTEMQMMPSVYLGKNFEAMARRCHTILTTEGTAL